MLAAVPVAQKFEHILVEKHGQDGSVGLITLNRPKGYAHDAH